MFKVNSPAGYRRCDRSVAWAGRVGVIGLSVLAACGGGGPTPTSQVAAKVNDQEISVHQVNFVAQRMSAEMTPERAAQAKREILDRLIEQQILVQSAIEQKIDREPAVMQQLEAARREILARSYLERVGSRAGKPEPHEISAFFGKNPDLFAERRIYKFDEIVLPGMPSNWPDLQKSLTKASTLKEAGEILGKAGLSLPVSQGVMRPAERLPINSLASFKQRKAGDLVVYPAPPRIVIAQLIESKPAPITEDKAGPVIEQFLMNRKRQELVVGEVKRLKESATIALQGEFANDKTGKPGTEQTPTAAGEQSLVAEEGAKPESSVDASILSGVKGLR